MRECDDTDDAELFGAEVCFVTSVFGRPWLRLLSKSMSTIFHKKHFCQPYQNISYQHDVKDKKHVCVKVIELCRLL